MDDFTAKKEVYDLQGRKERVEAAPGVGLMKVTLCF